MSKQFRFIDGQSPTDGDVPILEVHKLLCIFVAAIIPRMELLQYDESLSRLVADNCLRLILLDVLLFGKLTSDFFQLCELICSACW